MIFRLLRVAAFLIALAGVIDPAITSMRRTPPTIAIVAGDAASDAALADRVARELAPDFAIVRGPFAGAAAIVSAGDRLPQAIDTLPASMPAFAVTSAAGTASVRISRVQAPARVTMESRVSIEAAVRVEHSRGRTLDVTLRQAGVAIDRITRTLTSDDETVTATLTFVPTSPGATPLTISAGIDETQPRAAADMLVDVNKVQWAVLAFDRRPSWMSTFVRRALESDPRFVVTSRVITSRDLSTDTGRPPGSFDDLPSLALFDAVIVGAPEDLTERDVTGLESFLRRRGGTVCLLLDRRVAGPYERLIGAPAWSATATSAPASIDRAGADEPRLLSTEIAWPSALPPGAERIAIAAASAADASAPRPVVWSAAAGSGRVIVSGALDAWRFRDVAPSSFDRFWQRAVADAAAAAPPPVDVHVERPIVAPGESTDVAIVLRDEALADAERPVTATVHAVLETPSGQTAIRVWPDGVAGHFRTTVRAPDTPGMYRIAVTGNGTRVDAPFVVASQVAHTQPDERDLITAWTASHGGIAVSGAQSHEIGQALESRLPAATARTTWHPMRSAWWILPFALALGTEWWWRRVHGRA